MRNVYLVCYDVADDKRLRKTYKTMCGFGDPLQYSVFRCELSAVERQSLKESL
jgi:CRISPR-associated protein Cas2